MQACQTELKHAQERHRAAQQALVRSNELAERMDVDVERATTDQVLLPTMSCGTSAVHVVRSVMVQDSTLCAWEVSIWQSACAFYGVLVTHVLKGLGQGVEGWKAHYSVK